MTAQEFDGIAWDRKSVVIYNGVEHRVQGVNFKQRFVVVVAGHVWWFHEIELPGDKVDGGDNADNVRRCKDGGACLKPDMECRCCVLNE